MPKALALSLAFLATLLAGACNGAQTQAASPDLEAHTVTDGLEHPWSLAELPNGDLLVTERPGRLRLIQEGVLAEQAIPGMPEVFNRNQGGLFDVRLHPSFEQNRLIYLSYAKACSDGATTAIARGRLDAVEEGFYRLSNMATIFTADACRDGGRHFGGRMVFDSKGRLYLSVGDRGHRAEVQDPHNHLGSVLRLTADGAPAPGNPFADGVDGDPAVFTYGHRNPQGMARHPGTGQIWTHEHGPRGGDEVNRLSAADNYGWPKVTHGREYSGGHIGPESAPGYVEPLAVWVPSIAPSGLHIIDSSAFPDWQGDLLVGALAGQHVARLSWHPEQKTLQKQERLFEGRFGRIRAVGQLSDGALYLLTDASNGRLIRVTGGRP